MQHTSKTSSPASPLRLAALGLITAVVLSACGGGGGNPGGVAAPGAGSGTGTPGTGVTPGTDTGTGTGGSTSPTTPAAAPATVQFISADPSEKSIVMQGQGGINRTETATLKFKVLDVYNRPLAGQAVNFSVSVPALVRLNQASATTDANGEVSTTVNSGTVPTTFRVVATLPNTGGTSGTNISTTSDSIVVTTGLPVQRAFSLSAAKYNLDGWAHDSSPTQPATTIQVLVADNFGNPVPDGTPVIFQTNMGSVGSSDKGGCNTVNGGCSVDFRVQAPRIPTPGLPATPCNTGPGTTPDNARPGLATICASSTDGATTIFGRINLFFGDSTVGSVYLNRTPVDLNAGVVDLGTQSSAAPKVFELQFNDLNLNPLPFGTTVTVTNMVGGTAAAVVPATVPNIFPRTADGKELTEVNVNTALGSRHTFSVSNPAGKDCTVPVASTFDVTVTTPGNDVTTIPFKLTFSCP